MKKVTLAVLLLTGMALSSHAQVKNKKEKTVMVGGAAMYPSKNIVQNAVNSADHTTLVAAVKAAGLVETLQSAGPFTVFAPSNSAFNLLPAGTILTYHVVAGRLDSKELAKWLKNGKGTTELTTVEGSKLWVMAKGNQLWLKDEKGGMARINIKDVYQSNGVIHSIDHVLMPD
jgi:uncharacterized surface protein with fasciclin (FAS1) repeats